MKEAIRNELDSIAKKNRGRLSPESVVAFAADPKTALHECFTWDDEEEAHKWRLHVARNLIRVTVRILPSVNKEFRAFVSLKQDRVEGGGGYRRTIDVLSNPKMRSILLDQAMMEMNSWRERYNQLVELSSVFEAIDKMQDKKKKRKA